MGSVVLDLVNKARPGAFIDARIGAYPENAIIYRTRQPLIDPDLIEVPMLQDFGVFAVLAIMSGRTQVGICVRFTPTVIAKVTQGDYATFIAQKVINNPGIAKTAMKTNDFLIFSFSSRGALLIKKLPHGRGHTSAK